MHFFPPPVEEDILPAGQSKQSSIYFIRSDTAPCTLFALISKRPPEKVTARND